MILAHTGPAQLPGGDAVPVERALGGGQAVHGIGAGKSRLLCIPPQGIRPQLLRDLSEGRVAGVGEGLLQCLLPVDAGAGDGLVPDLDAAGAVPCPGLRVRQVLQCRRQGHGLEHRPGHKGGGEKPVQVRALITVILFQILGDVQGVIAGRRHHAQDLTGLVVIHSHRPGVATQSPVRLVVIPGVQGQVQIAPPLRAECAVHQIKAGQLVGKGVENAGADLAVQISHRMEGSLADGFIFIVGAVAVFHGGQHIPVPVQHRAGDQHAVGIVQMAVKGRGGPLAALGKIPDEKYTHPRRQ